MTAWAEQTLLLYLDAAPWLLLGLVAAGLIKAWVPDTLMNRWLGGQGGGPVLRAAVVGAPLPLCSCGVLPAAIGLRRAGASRGATVSFLVATPETGVDSIAVTYALMGPFMAVVRPIAAVFSAVVAGLLAALAPERVGAATEAAPACSGGSCCNSGCSPEPSATPSATSRAIAGLRYALSDVLDDIAGWLVAGLAIAGAVATFMPPAALAEWGAGPGAMLVMLLVGIPMYICATASTPVAAGLLLAGVSPGAVLVFLLAGPATNAATLALLRRELGTPVLVAYLAGIALTALAAGALTNAVVARFNIDIAAQLAGAGELLPLWLEAGSGLLLMLLVLRPLRRILFRHLTPGAGAA